MVIPDCVPRFRNSSRFRNFDSYDSFKVRFVLRLCLNTDVVPEKGNSLVRDLAQNLESSAHLLPHYRLTKRNKQFYTEFVGKISGYLNNR